MDNKKAKLKEYMESLKRDNGSSDKPATKADNASFPFWNTKQGETTTLRLLPDANPDAFTYWAFRDVITLEFEGVIGGQYPTNNKVKLEVPCNAMYGPKEKCPITEHIRPWWKGSEDDKALARKYYRKRSMITQGFVVSSNVPETSVPENPIRRFVFNSQIFKIIEADAEDVDFEYLPTHYERGRDLRINVTANGQYNNYTTSKFSPKERPLTEEELIAIDTYGLYDLTNFLPAKPSEAELEIIFNLFEDSLAGEAFDADKYEDSPYKPFVRRDNNEASGTSKTATRTAVAGARVTETAKAAVAAKEDEVEAEAPLATATAKVEKPAAPAATGATTAAQEALARLRARVQDNN